ncbi:hypothetical protein NE237_008415 [Protea cynaroides]|uniref:NADPH oxidase Respiratory burst domain-containing protein n=1 Tax=Protea cynaroides TaxID=273540 RepID=A0A9Q0QZB0_9MAGN|nr:hypothetical protein NE237_008415 [Protea cynaroides]
MAQVMLWQLGLAVEKKRATLDRIKSGVYKALRGLRFISNWKGIDGWSQIENNFEKFAKDSFLQRSDFGQCIEEFALELFDALNRRRRMKIDKINKEELSEFWSQISYESFDCRLQIFLRPDGQERRWMNWRRRSEGGTFVVLFPLKLLLLRFTGLGHRF